MYREREVQKEREYMHKRVSDNYIYLYMGEAG